MISKTVEHKIASGSVIFYRRVSTKEQAEDGYRHQLEVIKSRYSSFSITHSTTHDYKEAVSGLAEMGKRSASKLGTTISKLKRDPNSIMLVSEADRIARRADVFEMIQKQGLGHRVFVASSGLCLNELVAAGQHKKIEQQTQQYKEACRQGQQRYRDNGGTIGSPGIKNHSKSGSRKKIEQAKGRTAEVCKVVSQMTFANRGKPPSHGEVCDELRDREIRTGQGYFFTPPKLQQLKKGMVPKWEHATDSWHRPRRRIRHLISRYQIGLNHKRQRQLFMKRLRDVLGQETAWRLLDGLNWNISVDPHHFNAARIDRNDGQDGCRGPPGVGWGLMARSLSSRKVRR